MATQAHRGPGSQGSDHGSKSQCAGTKKQAGERNLPSRSDSTIKGTHHIVKCPDQAGIRVPARGPSHLHPTQGNNLNPATTRSYVEVVRGVAPRSRRPTMATGPPHHTRYNVYSWAPTHTSQHLPPRGASLFNLQHPPRHPTPTRQRFPVHGQHFLEHGQHFFAHGQHFFAHGRGGTAHPCPTTDNTLHNPHPCTPCVGKGTQHAQQGHKGEGRRFVLRLPKEGLSAGIWRRKVVMCPRRGNDPASGHPKAHQPPLGRGTSPPAWDGCLDAPGQRQRQLPSSVWTRRREVK